MTAQIELDIEKGLANYFKTLISRWPTHWPNVDADKPADKRYCRFTHLPSPPNTYGYTRDSLWFFGTLQITVVTERGVGPYIAKTEAARIARHFQYLTDAIDTPSGRIIILEEPAVVAAIDTDDTYEIPITIVYGLTEEA